MPQMFVDDELYCLVWSYFQDCGWNTVASYPKGKNPEGWWRTMRTPSPIPELDVGHDAPINAEDIPVIDVIKEWDDNIFQFIPLDPNEPGPSSAPWNYQHLSDEDNNRVIDSHPTAGKVIRMNDNLHTKWKKSFGLGIDPDSDGDIEMGGSDLPNGFALFASELDWRIAEWVIKDGTGHKAFDRLLNIPGVREKLGLSWTNILEPAAGVDTRTVGTTKLSEGRLTGRDADTTKGETTDGLIEHVSRYNNIRIGNGPK
ncbi:hypothetical protein C8R45DRAFT_947183 [Mycena sanguinolenta]|nr:hypothetical protein C8R45DRAFT_947183 [Mycena sanguinolenta]